MSSDTSPLLKVRESLIPRREMIILSGKALAGGALGAAVITGLDGCNAQQWFDMALADLPTIVQVVSGIVAIAADPSVAPAMEADIVKFAGQATTAIHLAEKLISEYKATPSTGLLGNIDAALIDAQNNLSAILGLFHVSNQTLVTTVAAALGLGITITVAVQALVPPPPGVTGARLAMSKGSGSNAAKEAFNLIVGSNYPNAILKIS